MAKQNREPGMGGSGERDRENQRERTQGQAAREPRRDEIDQERGSAAADELPHRRERQSGRLPLPD